jgi:FkbM family methyltransferase
VLERPNATVFNCALVPFGHPGGAVTMHYGGLMSIVAGARGSEREDREYVKPAFLLGLEDEREVQVPARTLSSILDEVSAPEIDLLSLDVEGFEPDVLGGLELHRHAPRYILVEVHEARGGRARIEAVLGERYEYVEHLSPVDALYRRRVAATVDDVGHPIERGARSFGRSAGS